MDCTSEPVVLTLQAIRYAQLEADKVGWKRIILRSDGQDIVNKLQLYQEFEVFSDTIAKDITLLSNLFEYLL